MRTGTGRRQSLRTVLVVAFLAQLLGLVGFKLVWPFLPLYLAELGVPHAELPLWAGVLDFAEEVAMAVAAPVWGVLGDRYGRKIMVVRALLGGAVVIMLIAAATNVYMVLVFVILSGLLTGVVSPLNALIASVTPRGQLSRVMGRMLAAGFLANTIGPLIGGTVSDTFGFRGGFFAGAALLATGAVLVALLIREPRSSGRDSTGARKPRVPFWTQLRQVTRVPGFAALLICLSVMTFAGFLLYPIFPVLVPQLDGLISYGGEVRVATAVGLSLGVPGVTGLFASWKAHVIVERWGCGRTLLWSTAVAAVLTASLAMVEGFWTLVVIRAVGGLFLGVAQVSIGAMVGVLAPQDLYSTAYGIAGSVQAAATAFGFLGGGLIGFWLGLRSVFLVGGFFLMVVACIGYVCLRSLDPKTDEPRLGDVVP